MLATLQGRATFVIVPENQAELDTISRQKLCYIMEQAIVEAPALGYSLDARLKWLYNSVTWSGMIRNRNGRGVPASA